MPGRLDTKADIPVSSGDRTADRIPPVNCATLCARLVLGLAIDDPAVKELLSGADVGPSDKHDEVVVNCKSSMQALVTGQTVTCGNHATLRVAPSSGTIELSPETINAVSPTCARDLQSALIK